MNLNHAFTVAIISLVLLFSFSSCSDDAEARVAALEEELANLKDSEQKNNEVMQNLMDEMDAINAIIDSIAFLEGADNMDRLSATQKVRFLDSLLAENKAQVEMLSSELDTQNPAIDRQLARYRRQVSGYKTELDTLKARLDRSDREVVTLSNLITEKDRVIAQKDDELLMLENEKAMIRTQIDSIREERIAFEQETKKSKAQSYFEMGTEIYGVAEKMSGAFNKKKKRQLVLQAHDMLSKSGNLGNLSAKNMAADIEMKHKKYFD